MKIAHYREAETKVFDKEPARGVEGRVVIGKADGAKNFCMRVFELSPGGHTPKHSHDWEHEIFIHSGVGAVLRADEKLPLQSGNIVFIPGGEMHQLENTGNEPFIFVCLIPAGPAEL